MTRSIRVLAAVALSIAAVGMSVRIARGDLAFDDWVWALLLCLAYSPSAALLAGRSRGLGLAFLGIGLSTGVGLFTAAVQQEAAERGFAGTTWLLWTTNWVWSPAYLLLLGVLPALLPDGRPTRRLPLLVGLAATVVGALGWALTPYDAIDELPDLAAAYGLRNPVGIEGAQVLLAISVVLLAAAVLLGIAALVGRWRRASEDERDQLSWVLLGVLATALLLGLARLVPDRTVPMALAALPLPVSVVVAVLRHGLYDVQLLLRRTLVWLLLSLVVGLAYVAAVTALGSVLGARTGAPAVAAAVVALGIAPIRSRLQRGVSRLLYGQARDPGAAVTDLGHRLAAVQAPQEALQEAADEVARALRLPGVAIQVHEGPSVRSGTVAGQVLRLPLVHQGAQVGVLEVAPRRPGEDLRPADQRLLRALAVQAGAAAALAHADAELRRSREQVVRAREEERRRLRRDLHDSLGPTLASVALQVEALPDLPAGTLHHVSDRLTAQVQAAVDDVRRILEGLGPGALDDLGLDEALRELGDSFSTAAVPVVVEVGPLPALPAAVEAAAIRAAGEALSNAVRHARAGRITVTAAVAADGLELRIVDDGVGTQVPSPRAGSGLGLHSLRRAAAEIGGRCEVRSCAAGTTVELLLPLGTPA